MGVGDEATYYHLERASGELKIHFSADEVKCIIIIIMLVAC